MYQPSPIQFERRLRRWWDGSSRVFQVSVKWGTAAVPLRVLSLFYCSCRRTNLLLFPTTSSANFFHYKSILFLSFTSTTAPPPSAWTRSFRRDQTRPNQPCQMRLLCTAIFSIQSQAHSYILFCWYVRLTEERGAEARRRRWWHYNGKTCSMNSGVRHY